jgi:predicted amidohydrolase YtcJ
MIGFSREVHLNDINTGTKSDLILHNARVITLDPEQPYAELIAIKGNRILATGREDDLSVFKGAGTKTINCEGEVVIPGFNDAHCHPISLAVSLLSIDCSPEKVTNIAEIQERIHRGTEQTPQGKWIRAANYDEYYLKEKRPPNCWELDKACSDHPVILVHRTAGKCVLNSLALRLAGITQETSESSAGLIQNNFETGEGDGIVSGKNDLGEKAIPPLDEEDLERGMKMVNLEYLSHGITSVQDTGWNNGIRHWQTWQRLLERGIVSQRVTMLLGAESLAEWQNMGLSLTKSDDKLRIGGIKIALDESTGNPDPPQQDINDLALRAYKAGFQIAFHVSNVSLLDASLNAIDFVNRESPPTEKRFRLEHCAICPPGLLLKIRASGAVVVTQPSFLYYLGQKYQEEALPYQTNWFQPIRSFNRWGVKVAFSSDAPLVSSNPFTGIWAAVNRKTKTGQKLAPQESISALEAIKMYTLGGAFASFEEGIKGTISPGKLADLAVLNGDPAHLAPEQLLELKVKYCIVDGRVMWG